MREAVQVDRECLRLMCNHAIPAALASLAVATGTCVVLVAVGGGYRPLWWLAAVFAISLVRLLAFRHARRTVDTVEQPIEVLRKLAVFAAFAGLSWGALFPLFLTPDEPMIVIICILAVFGICAGAVGSLSAYPPAFAVFLLGAIAPSELEWISFGGTFALAVGLMSVAYVVASLSFARSTHRTLIEAIELRFANEALVRRVTEEKERAEQANLAKARFLAAASHDLRQPLHAQALFVGALAAHPADERVRYLTSRIEATGTALGTLLDALLDISRLDAGAIQPEIGTFQIQVILDQLATEFGALAEEKRVELRIVPSSTRVVGDPALVSRIARNLVSNAIRYTPSGGRVVVGCKRGQPARLVVGDTGIGIAEADRERIFEEFVQLHNPERDRAKGIGLGLAIVRRLVDLLGATVTVRSRPGRGSLFSVALESITGPVTEDAALQPIPLARPVRELAAARRRILVIDDELLVRTALDELLSAWGFQVTCVASGEDAARVARATPPELVIADYRLRAHETGYEAVHRVLRELAVPVPTLLITGDTDPERIREARATGLPLAHKPLAPAELRRLIDDALAP